MPPWFDRIQNKRTHHTVIRETYRNNKTLTKNTILMFKSNFLLFCSVQLKSHRRNKNSPLLQFCRIKLRLFKNNIISTSEVGT